MWNNALLLRSLTSALFYLSTFAALCGATYYAVHLPGLFPLYSVRLDSAPQRIDAAQVLQVVRTEARGNFFTVDIERLRSALEKLPWVQSVTIRRVYPGRLAVKLAEHQVLARWNHSALVNVQGEIFNGRSEQPLADFIGQSGDSVELALRYVQFGKLLAPLNLQVAQIVLSPRHAWQLHLSNGLVLELGREEMQQRLARFVAVYPYSLALQGAEDRGQRTEGAVRYVDLRYRNGFAVGGMVKG